MNNNHRIQILGVGIDPVTKESALSKIDELMVSGKKRLICTVNTEFIEIANKDAEFKRILNNSYLNLADGIGVLWAAKFNSLVVGKSALSKIEVFFYWLATLILIPLRPNYFKSPIPMRITGADFVWDLAKYARDKNYKIFLLGGMPTVAERTALQLQTKVYGLKVVGVHSGSPKDTEDIVNCVNKSKADIILVAFGVPNHSKWLDANMKNMCCKIGVGVGGTFDFIAGVRKRAPIFMQKLGLEWLFRLIQEPKRIKRQLSLPAFVINVLKNKINEHK